MSIKPWLRLAALASAPFAVCAQAALPAAPGGNATIELQAEARREVANDLLNAALYFEANDASAARLADTLNRAGNEALKTAADFKAVQTRSGGSNTYPVYDRNQRLSGWRGRVEIRVESRDFQAASGLIAKLQSSMQLGSISFSLSRESRVNNENELIKEALGAFRARADIVRQALGAKRYRLRRIALHTGGSAPPRPLAQRAMAGVGAAEVAAPQFEGGMGTVTVSVSGSIEVE